jgi:hypothetical protein
MANWSIVGRLKEHTEEQLDRGPFKYKMRGSGATSRRYLAFVPARQLAVDALETLRKVARRQSATIAFGLKSLPSEIVKLTQIGHCRTWIQYEVQTSREARHERGHLAFSQLGLFCVMLLTQIRNIEMGIDNPKGMVLSMEGSAPCLLRIELPFVSGECQSDPSPTFLNRQQV